MEIVISDTNIFIDLWNIGLLERFCELPLSIHTTDFIIGELKTQGVKDAIAQLHQEGKSQSKLSKAMSMQRLCHVKIRISLSKTAQFYITH